MRIGVRAAHVSLLVHWPEANSGTGYARVVAQPQGRTAEPGPAGRRLSQLLRGEGGPVDL